MSTKMIMINEMLSELEEKDYETIIEYIKALSAVRKKERAMKALAAMEEFSEIVGEDKGWDSEKDMIRDMAEFRRSRVYV